MGLSASFGKGLVKTVLLLENPLLELSGHAFSLKKALMGTFSHAVTKSVSILADQVGWHEGTCAQSRWMTCQAGVA